MFFVDGFINQASGATDMWNLTFSDFLREQIETSFKELWTLWNVKAPGGFFKKIRTGMLKVEFKISTISIPRKVWFCDPSVYHFSAKSTQDGAHWVLFSYIFQNTPNFANWAHWVCDDNPPIDIPKLTKMHHKTFEHPRIPCVSENPPPPG